MVYFTFGINDENLAQIDSNRPIAYSISVSVAEASVEWFQVIGVQVHYIFETSDFEDLGFLQDNFPVEAS